MKNKKHIAMRCNQEQFEAIKPKLEDKVKFDTYFKELDIEYPYLTNYYSDEKNSLGWRDLDLITKEEIHEEWNEKIFLEACGIELDPKFEITKEQILLLMDKCKPGGVTEKRLKEWFPEVFKPVLEVKKWYKSDIGGLWFIEKFKDGIKTQTSYGINKYGNWQDISYTRNSTGLVLATPEEVTGALIQEAVRRGFVEGAYFKGMVDGSVLECKGDIKIIPNEHLTESMKGKTVLEMNHRDIFKNGIWATVIQAKTIQQAEELLKELGHEIKIVS